MHLSSASIPHTFWQIPFTCQTFAICGQHILKLAPACAAHHTHHTHTQSLHNRPHNNNSISQPSSSCLLLSPSHFLPSQSTGDRATFMPKLCQLFADLAFAACADFDFWFEFKMPATTTTITICIPHIHSHTLSLEFHFMRIVAAFKHILRSSSSR